MRMTYIARLRYDALRKPSYPMDPLVTRTAKVTISLPVAMLEAADDAGAREHRSRSELIREALRWYLRLGELRDEKATPQDLAAVEAGRADRARGETLTLDDIR